MTPPNFNIRFLSTKNPKYKKLEESLARNLQSFNNRRVGPSHFKLLGLAVRDRKGKIVGGLKGETFRGWLHVALLWVDRRHRKRGLGRWLMNEAEKTALRRKCRASCVETGNFQASGFYPLLGYRCVGRWKMSPKITAYYFMKDFAKAPPAPNGGIDGEFQVENLANKKKLVKMAKTIAKKLFAFSAKKVGATRRRQMALELRGPEGRLAGGLVGDSLWNCFMVDMLWVSPSFTRQGLGKHLLQTAEKRARQWGCDQATSLVYDFQSLKFFQKAGFRPFASYPNLPKGHTRFHLKKKLGRSL